MSDVTNTCHRWALDIPDLGNDVYTTPPHSHYWARNFQGDKDTHEVGLDLPSSDHGLRTRSLSSEGTASTLKRILYTALNKTCRGSYGVFCVDLTRVYNAERSCHSIPCSFRYLRNQLIDDTCSLKQRKVDTPGFTTLPLLPELWTPTTISPSLDWRERPYRCHAEVLPYRSSGLVFCVAMKASLLYSVRYLELRRPALFVSSKNLVLYYPDNNPFTNSVVLHFRKHP